MILINPPTQLWFTYPHLGPAYIAAGLERVGEPVEIIDCQYRPDYKQELAAALKRHTTVGLTVNVAGVSSALEIAEWLRATHPKKRIVMGGPLATAAYSQLIPRYADIVVLGEGEETMAEIITQKDLARIKGIAWWDGSLRLNPRRDLIDDLDSIPYPAWHLVDLDKYRYPVPRRMATMMTSRGCPFDCINCTKLVHGYRVRLRSVDNILGEIDYLVERFGVKEIHFWDDLFTYKPSRIKQLCRAIIKRKYKNLRLGVPAGIRADIADREMFTLMRQAGFYAVIVAIESGVQSVINGLGKQLDLSRVKDTLDLLRKTGFKIGAFFMLGTPHDNAATMCKTIEFAKQLKIHHVFFFITIPFPGTKLYDLVAQKGRFLQDLRLASRVYDEGKAVYEFGELKAGDTEQAFKRAYREFYFRPSQIWRTATKLLEDPASLIYMFQQGWSLLSQQRRGKLWSRK